jgi:predicted nucleotidyltransferase
MLQSMLNLRSKLRQNLLAYYFLNPAADHYLRELASLLKVDPTNLSRELGRLEQEGLFISRRRGNQKYFILNRGYPLFNEVRRIVLKTAGIVPALRGAVSEIPGIEGAYLYGSFAKGEEDAKSDIDLLIVGNPRPDELESVVRKFERFFRRENKRGRA